MHTRTGALNDSALFDDSAIVPLTENRLKDFHALLVHQARSHASDSQIMRAEHSRELYKAIVGEQRAEAFLVVSPKRDMTLAAATYYDSLRGIHLEDIITSPEARRSGAGMMAMTGMAQIAAQRHAKSVVWECAEDNESALRFYDKLGCVHESDRHTWRLLGPVAAKSATDFVREQFVRNSRYVAAPLSRTASHGPASAHHQMTVTVHRSDGSAVGEMQASRSFSTFRIVHGMHIETVKMQSETSEVLVGLLEQVGAGQRAHGWHGHTDITVHKSQENFLQPVLEQYGFKPLSYGTSRMLTFSLSGQALQDLANHPRRNLIAELTPPAAAVRPVNSAAHSVGPHCTR